MGDLVFLFVPFLERKGTQKNFTETKKLKRVSINTPLSFSFCAAFSFQVKRKSGKKQIYALLSLRNRSYSTGTMNTVMSVA